MRKHIATIVAVVLCIVLLGTAAINGFTLGDWEWPSFVSEDSGIVLDVDLQGGARITFQAIDDRGNPITSISGSDFDATERVFRRRLDNQGFTQSNIFTSGPGRITIEIPGQNPDDDLIDLLGRTARLNFRYLDNVIITSDQVNRAYAFMDDGQGIGVRQPVVTLNFDRTARAAFREATRQAAAAPSGTDANRIFIYLDDEQISAPHVTQMIDSTESVITLGAGQTLQDARNLAELINGGMLPFSLELAAMHQVSASLGEEALNTSIIAGILGLILLMLFMIGYYRVPGAVAALVLLMYVTISLSLMNILGINLTLPGIAGIILTIGMAVDAEIVIFERIKDELRAGKTLRAAIESGFRRARGAIVDTCLTTLISAGVLFFMGEGPIRGFATTLFLGVGVSLFTALVITMALLRALVGMNVTNPALYGVKNIDAEVKA